MFGSSQFALLSALVVAATGALGSIQHSSIALDRRAVSDGQQCWTDFNKNPELCTIVQVAYFKDSSCSEPLPLVKTSPRAQIKGNTQMLWDGALSRSLKQPFGSLRVVASVEGIGIGFAKRAESDSVIQNMAYMSPADVYKAYQTKACVTFPNLDTRQIGLWSARFENVLNAYGYVWNPENIPLKRAARCSGSQRQKRHLAHTQPQRSSAYMSVCLESVSWGGGGVLETYDTPDCTGGAKTQLYSTAQCTPLSTTRFKSFKIVQPKGPTVGPIFSPVYYSANMETGYHACAKRDVTAKPFKVDECQRFAANDMFVGVYADDPNPKLAMAGPAPGDKIMLKGHGNGLLAPNPKHGAKHGGDTYGK